MRYCTQCGKRIEDNSIVSEGKNLCRDCIIEFLKATNVKFEWTKGEIESEANND